MTADQPREGVSRYPGDRDSQLARSPVPSAHVIRDVSQEPAVGAIPRTRRAVLAVAVEWHDVALPTAAWETLMRRLAAVAATDAGDDEGRPS